MDREDIEYIESGELGHSTGDGSDAENMLSERIVRKGSRWQVQSEKGRNMGTYDTRKEAEDRLRDIEMFKHMKESGNHSVNESLQDEIERSLPVSDNYLDQSAQYILPDGRFLLLDDPDTGTAAYDDSSDSSGMHGDEFEYLRDAGLFGTWQEYAKYRDSQGWIEASDSHPEDDSCIRIAYIEPTEAQYRSIERFADHCLDSWGYIKVEIGRNQEFYRAFCLDDSYCPDYMDPSNEEVGNFTGYEIARRIRNYFHSVGNSSIAEDMTSDGRHIVYRVGQVDDFRQGLFFADSLDYYNKSDVRYDKNDIKAYELDMSGARVFDPTREWGMNVYEWNDIRQGEKFLRDRGFFYYEYLDDIDYDDPDTYHEVMTDTDHLSQWAYENGYDAIIIRNTPNIGGNVDNLTEYCIFDKSLIKPLTQETKQDENYDINESMEGHEVDSEGNALSKDQSSYFRNSKVRDSSGHLKVVYHGTGSKFNSFSKGDVGFHFGTLGQAKAIAGDRDEGHVDAYYLNIGNPAEMYDFGPTGPYSILWWWKAQSFDDYGSIFGFDMTREELDKVNRVLGNMGEKTLDDIHTDADADKCDHEIRDMYNSPQSKLVRGLLGDRGYDGIVYTNNFEDADTNINTGDISYIAFEPNQIKSVSNKTPTNSNNINESTEVSEKDNEGNVLSSEQVEFFRDSKIRTGMNGYGNLRVCYNGQPRDWGNEYRKLDTVQFKFKDKPNDFGFFFTNSRDTASKYAKNNPSSQNGGIVKSVYLNIVNPLVFKNMVCTRDDFLGELKDNNVDTGFDVKDSSRVRRRNVWEWIDLYGSELRKNIVKAGYDGVIFDEGWDKTIVAFNPNQIKSIDNKNPTNSNNINEDYEPDVYYRGYDSRYGVFDSNNQYGQLYTWVTDEPEYALEYAEHNEYGKVAKVRVTCDDRKIGGVSDLPDDADYYDPGDDIFREYILSNGLEGYGFTAGEYDDFCMCVSKDCVEVVDPDFKVGDEVDESLREGNRLTLDYNSIVKDELETLNKWLDKYDFRVELVDDYEFETHDVGMFLNTIQDDAYVFPIALNRDVIEEYCQGSTGMLVDAIEGTLWHEAGHGIYNFLQDSGCDMPQDEEECVEEFARYVEYSRLFGILDDYMKDCMDTDEPLNESKADQQKFIDKFGQDVFDLFNKSKDRLRNNKVSTDILYHVKNTSVEDMKNILHNLQAKVKTGDNNVDLTKIQGKYNFLGSRDGYDVYEPLDVVASMSLGVGTGWCTTGRYGHAGDVNFKPSLKDAKEHWDEYTSEGVRFFYFLQNGIGKYALALYPKVFEVGEYIDRETYLKSCNFELYNQEDIPEYKGLSRIPYDLIGDDLVINTIVAQNGLILSEDGKKLMRAIKSISSCTIPDGVEEIKDMAFAYCTSLTSVTIPNSVKEIGVYAFDSCTSLTSINISNNVKEIGYSTFHGCTSLTSVMIPNGVDKIGACAFWGCESLSSISIPNSVTHIDNRAFAYCKSLESISIPEGVTIIQSKTFADCTSLTTVNIPNSMKTIGESAFAHCTSLTSLIIPDSVNSIDDYAFIECPNLTVKTNNKYAIDYCKKNDIPVEPLKGSLKESSGGTVKRYCDLKVEINTDVSRQYQKDKDKSLGGSLDESKHDMERFRKWAGDELADRFIAVKQRLNGNEKDIYYWMGKEKDILNGMLQHERWKDDIEKAREYAHENVIEALKSVIETVENTPTRKELDTEAREGAEKLYDDGRWIVLKINNYEASVKYGKHTLWCITGNNSYSGGGKLDWDAHTKDGVEFYFYIDRKDDHKYALEYSSADNWALYSDEDYVDVGKGSLFNAAVDCLGEPWNGGYYPEFPNVEGLPDLQKAYRDANAKNLGEGYFEGDFNNVYDNMLQYESKEPALGPAFITRDGTFINLERFHGDIFGDIDDYEGEDFYTLEDNFGLIKLNGGNSYEPFPYVDLWTRPNEMQSRALVEWMYFLMERGKRKVLVNTPSSDRIYEFGKTLPEEILKDAFRDMGEQLQERVFDRGIDLGKYVLKYVRENLDDLIQSELDNVYNTYGFTEEDIENEIARINSIHSAQDYIDYVGDGIDWVEDIVLKELQDRFLDIVGYVEDKVYELISSRDGMDCHLDVTHSFSPGNFPSHYLTVTKEVGDDIEERTIRIGDGHDNGRNDSDLEIDFEDMLDCPDYYDRDIEDLVADLDSSLGESLDSSVINEAKGDWEKFREWCGDDSIYNRFVRVQKRLAGKQRDIYYWMGLEKSLGKHGAMQELLAMLRDVESTPTKREREASARDGATLLYDSNGWKVYKIETLEASQKYGKDTTWCISGDGEGGNYDAADFWEGNEDQTYFFIHGDDKYALIWERGASDWDIWNAMDGKEPYVKGAPAVPGLPDISRPSPELLKGIAKCLGIPAGDILDIHVADYDDELSELFYDYDASGNYIVDTKGGTCYVIDTLGDFEDVTQDIEDALEEYDEE